MPFTIHLSHRTTGHFEAFPFSARFLCKVSEEQFERVTSYFSDPDWYKATLDDLTQDIIEQ